MTKYQIFQATKWLPRNVTRKQRAARAAEGAIHAAAYNSLDAQDERHHPGCRVPYCEENGHRRLTGCCGKAHQRDHLAAERARKERLFDSVPTFIRKTKAAVVEKRATGKTLATA